MEVQQIWLGQDHQDVDGWQDTRVTNCSVLWCECVLLGCVEEWLPDKSKGSWIYFIALRFQRNNTNQIIITKCGMRLMPKIIIKKMNVGETWMKKGESSKSLTNVHSWKFATCSKEEGCQMF